MIVHHLMEMIVAIDKHKKFLLDNIGMLLMLMYILRHQALKVKAKFIHFSWRENNELNNSLSKLNFNMSAKSAVP